MKKLNYLLIPLIFTLSGSLSNAQTPVFDIGSYGKTCPGPIDNVCSSDQPNYDVTANTVTGDVYLLKREYVGNLGPASYRDKIIRFNSLGTRITELVLGSGLHSKVVADNGTGVYKLSVSNDSVIVTRHDQNSLAVSWAKGIYNGAGSPEAFDICIAFGYIYFGLNDANGMHLYKLNKNTGNIASSVNYNTTFASNEHGLDLETSSTAVFVAGYLDEPGTSNGDELWLAKFNNNLGFSYQKRYNNHLALTNNSDRASHVHISNDTVYVSGTVTTNTGNVNAILLSYAHNGTFLWKKTIDKGPNDNTVDCSVDKSNGDVYLLQNAKPAGSVNQIFVSRFNSAGTKLWTNGYGSTDTTAGPITLGYSISADPNPGGGGCEIYISGQRSDFGGDPHGYGDGLNLLFYKLNRAGVTTVILAPNAGTGGGGIAPLNKFTKSVYFPTYTGGPRLLLISDGDYSNPSPFHWGWRLMSYDISSVARLSEDQKVYLDQSNLVLMPNPAFNNTILKANEPMDVVSIYTITGQLTAQYKPSAKEISIDVKDLPKGVYVVQATINAKPFYTRLVVQ